MNTQHQNARPYLRFLSFLINILLDLFFFQLVLLVVVGQGRLENMLNSLLTAAILWLFFSVIKPFFNSLLISRFGGDPGKLLTGTAIIRSQGGNLSFWRAFFRNFLGYTVSGLLVWLGFVWILIDKQHRAWHDLISDTVVIVRSKSALLMGIISMALLLLVNVFVFSSILSQYQNNKTLYEGVWQDVSEVIRETFKENPQTPDEQFQFEDTPEIPDIPDVFPPAG